MKVTRGNRRAAALPIAGIMASTVALAVTGCASSDSGNTPTTGPAGFYGVEVVVYRSPTCGCCKSYEEYLRRHGFSVTSEVTDDMDSVKSTQGVPSAAESCHTAVIGDYAIEGHVPVEAIRKLLDERPAIDGIAVPGMPANSPGMGEPNGVLLEVQSINDGQVAPFTSV